MFAVFAFLRAVFEVFSFIYFAVFFCMSIRQTTDHYLFHKIHCLYQIGFSGSIRTINCRKFQQFDLSIIIQVFLFPPNTSCNHRKFFRHVIFS